MHVDDDPTVTEAVRRILQKLGYNVDSFNSPYCAIDRLRTAPQHFCLVLTDLIMPGMNGLQFASAVISICPKMPVVLFSGYTDNYSEDEISRSGICEILEKPADIPSLADVIRRAIDRTQT
jgi:DNA-binding NtrC family response regulator